MTKNRVHGQLADLRVQVVDDRLLIGLPAVGAACEHFPQTLLRLTFPARDLVRVHLVLGRDRLDRAVAAQRLHGHPCFDSAVNRRRFVAISLALLMARITP